MHYLQKYRCSKIDKLIYVSFQTGGILTAHTIKLQEELQLSKLSFELRGYKNQVGKIRFTNFESYSAEVVAIPVNSTDLTALNILLLIFQKINAKLGN